MNDGGGAIAEIADIAGSRETIPLIGLIFTDLKTSYRGLTRMVADQIGKEIVVFPKHSSRL